MCKCSVTVLNLKLKSCNYSLMMTKLVKSMHMISKHMASRISHSRNIVVTNIIDKIIETNINSQILTRLRKVTY